jgi:Lipocalin-like domain
MTRFLALLLLLHAPLFSLADDDRTKLVGNWKLVSWDIEIQATGERRPGMGGKTSGWLIFTPEGRMMALITAEDRKPAKTTEERAALYSTMLANTGTYRIEGDRFITKVDLSWNEAWNGTEQVRFYKMDGDRLDIVSAWAKSFTIPGEPMTRGVLTWQRIR